MGKRKKNIEITEIGITSSPKLSPSKYLYINLNTI